MKRVPFTPPADFNWDEVREICHSIRRHLDDVWEAASDAMLGDDSEADLEWNSAQVDNGARHLLGALHYLEDQLKSLEKAEQEAEVPTVGHAITVGERRESAA